MTLLGYVHTSAYWILLQLSESKTKRNVTDQLTGFESSIRTYCICLLYLCVHKTISFIYVTICTFFSVNQLYTCAAVILFYHLSISNQLLTYVPLYDYHIIITMTVPCTTEYSLHVRHYIPL